MRRGGAESAEDRMQRAVRNLAERYADYPQIDMAVIERALQAAGGHAGKASFALDEVVGQEVGDERRANIRTLQRGAVGIVRMRAGGAKVDTDVQLRVQLVIVNIPEIDTEAQTFMADVVVEAVAEGRHELVRDLEAEKEPGQDVPPKHKSGDKKPKPEALFNPGATILNAKDVDLIEESVETRQRDAVWRWRWRGEFSEEFELFDFPFDVQDFSIRLAFRPSTSKKGEAALRVRQDKVSCHCGSGLPQSKCHPSSTAYSPVLFSKSASIFDQGRKRLMVTPSYRAVPVLLRGNEWGRSSSKSTDQGYVMAGTTPRSGASIHGHEYGDYHEFGHVAIFQHDNFTLSNVWSWIWAGLTDPLDEPDGTVLPLLVFRLLMARRPEAYIWNILMPMSLLTTMGVFTYGLPPSDMDGRLGICLTLLLTAVAYKFTAAEGLPKLGYLTALDKFVFGSIFFLTLLAVEVFCSSKFSDELSRKTIGEHKLIFVWIACWMGYVLVNWGYWLSFLLRVRRIPHDFDPGTVSPKTPRSTQEEQRERNQKRLFIPGASAIAAVERPRRGSSETTRILTRSQLRAKAKKEAAGETRLANVILENVVN